MEINTTKPQEPVAFQIKTEEKFEVDGQTLSMLIGLLEHEVNTPEMKKMLLVQQAFKNISDVVKKGLDEGKINQIYTQEDIKSAPLVTE